LVGVDEGTVVGVEDGVGEGVGVAVGGGWKVRANAFPKSR
jgi:hypothetical protein